MEKFASRFCACNPNQLSQQISKQTFHFGPHVDNRSSQPPGIGLESCSIITDSINIHACRLRIRWLKNSTLTWREASMTVTVKTKMISKSTARRLAAWYATTTASGPSMRGRRCTFKELSNLIQGILRNSYLNCCRLISKYFEGICLLLRWWDTSTWRWKTQMQPYSHTGLGLFF